MARAEKLTPGPVGAGTRFRAAMTRRRSTEMTVELTRYERPSLLASTARLTGMEVSGTLTFHEAGGGTVMRWSWDVRPSGVVRLLDPLVGRLGRRQEQEIWSNLKRLLEGGAHAG